MQKPKLLLLDANVVVDAHIHGIWDALKQTYEIAVPSIIVNEAQFFRSETRKGGINLKVQAERGEITVFEGTVADVTNAFSGISDAFMAGIHGGEQEAIALICSGKCEGYQFCSGDINAIEAMGLLNIGNRSISFENIVNGLKLKQRIRLDPSLSEKAHAHHLKVGNDLRISEVYFVKKARKK